MPPDATPQDAEAPPARLRAFWSTAGGTTFPVPAMRSLRVYAFDPQASTDVGTATVNNSLIRLRWESPWERPLTPGPCGEYLEVIDHDPASGLFYEPVDLGDPTLLAQHGLPPSEGRPQFHQQMVYAVAMKTIYAFERALGRSIYFARETPPTEGGGESDASEHELIHRLRIYPHALRERNAYYSPEKTAVLFGYFQPEGHATSGERWVFTCLSQDVIAHETAHAILHGVDRRSVQPSNLDTLAFHEGFADVVALMQHFTMQDVLKQQIAQTRGDLRRRSLLNSLAGQYGQALGRKNGALRNALDLVELDAEISAAQTDFERQALVRKHWQGPATDAPAADAKLDVDQWKALLGRRHLNEEHAEPHDRGGFLVAAIFDAFATIYEQRTADLLRLGLAGSITSTARELPPELVGRLAAEAGKAADHVLRMCVRALDYVPPVDLTFGEYLRAIITADHDLVPEDPLCYRVAVAQAFRKRGIVPENSLSMAPDSLLWEAPNPADLPTEEYDGANRCEQIFADLLSNIRFTIDYKQVRDRGNYNLREANASAIDHNRKEVEKWFESDSDEDDLWAELLGVEMLSVGHRARAASGVPPRPLKSVRWKDDGTVPIAQVSSVRVARRSGPDGQDLSQLVIQVVQKRRGCFNRAEQSEVDATGPRDWAKAPDFWFRGGATLLIDLRDGRLRYAIRKRIDNNERLERQREFEKRRRRGIIPFISENEDDIGVPSPVTRFEPFAMAHRGLC